MPSCDWVDKNCRSGVGFEAMVFEATGNHVAATFLDFAEHFFDNFWIDFVVGVKKHDVLSGSFFESGVASGGRAGILLIDEDNSVVLLFGFFE